MAFDGLDSKISYFLKCARSETFRGAAIGIGISQAALSQSMRKLEDEIGAKLFDRSSTGVSLTAQGRALFKVFESNRRQIEREVRASLDQDGANEIRIGCVSHVGLREFLPLVQRFAKELPPLQLFFGYSLSNLESVRTRRLDLAFVTWTSKPKGLAHIAIRKDPKAIVGLGSKFASIAKAKSRSELSEFPWIYQFKPQYDWSDRIRIGKNAYVVQDMYAHRELILSGAGISSVQLSIFTAEERKRLAVSSVPPDHENVRLYAVFREDAPGSIKALARYFAEKWKSVKIPS